MNKKPHVTLTIDDVLSSGSVRQAIIDWAKDDDYTSSGEIGPSFSTSGPGPGWSRQHTTTDYAARALKDEGALHYIDADTGRLASLSDAEDEEADEELDIEWTDESVVMLECPPFEDAWANRDIALLMANAATETHSAMSDCFAWGKLVDALEQEWDWYDGELVRLEEDADTAFEDPSDFYDSYGWHISTEHCGDVCLQAVKYEWLDLADDDILAELKSAYKQLTDEEAKELIDRAHDVRESAETICGWLQEAVDRYEDENLRAVIAAIENASREESKHGDDPASRAIAKQLLTQYTE